MSEKDDIIKQMWDAPLELRLKSFISRLNRHLWDGYSGPWTYDDLGKEYVKLEEIMSYLTKWDERGYVKIYNTKDCLFKVLKPIKDIVEDPVGK